MKNIRKVLLISGITLGLFCGVSNAQAEAVKVLTNHGSKTVVVSEPSEHHCRAHHKHRRPCKFRRHAHFSHFDGVVYRPVVYRPVLTHVVYHPHHHHRHHDGLRLPIWLSINL